MKKLLLVFFIFLSGCQRHPQYYLYVYYAKTCHLLEDYVVNDQSGSVPFIVLDGYFALVGYQMGEDQMFLTMVQQALAGEELSVGNHEVYFFKEGQTFHEGG